MTAYELLREERRAPLVIALLRVSIGIMFLLAAWPKVSAGTGWTGRMQAFLGAQQNTPDWYRSFLDTVVIPNAELFAYLTAYGELAVGLALVLGVLTRAALIGALVMVVNFLFAKGLPFWTPASIDSYVIMILLTLLLHGRGDTLSVAAWVRRTSDRAVAGIAPKPELPEAPSS